MRRLLALHIGTLLHRVQAAAAGRHQRALISRLGVAKRFISPSPTSRVMRRLSMSLARASSAHGLEWTYGFPLKKQSIPSAAIRAVSEAPACV